MNHHDPRPIIVVEDSDDDFEAVEFGLRQGEGPVNPLLRFDNGEEAVSYLLNEMPDNRETASRSPSFVLLDLNLPGGGGLPVLAAIKSNPALKRIPVVILSTSGDPRDVDKCYDAGANTYIQKSVDLDQFLDKIQRVRDYWLSVAVLSNGGKN